MTEPGAADRVAVLRGASTDTAIRHGQAAKILTAGGTISLVLGLVASLAHASQEQEAKDNAIVEAIVVPVPTPAPTPAPAPRPVTTSGQPAPAPAATTKSSG